MRFFF